LAATNRSALSDSEIIHWNNQRAVDSETRIKELKFDFGGDTFPCSDFNANALYFRIAVLSYNSFALMRQLLPEYLASHRATTDSLALIRHGRKTGQNGAQDIVKATANQQKFAWASALSA
jgi:hypothetical protein